MNVDNKFHCYTVVNVRICVLCMRIWHTIHKKARPKFTNDAARIEKECKCGFTTNQNDEKNNSKTEFAMALGYKNKTPLDMILAFAQLAIARMTRDANTPQWHLRSTQE